MRSTVYRLLTVLKDIKAQSAQEVVRCSRDFLSRDMSMSLFAILLLLSLFILTMSHQKRPCVCDWEDCSRFQDQIMAYCLENGESHVALGQYKVSNLTGTQRLRGSIAHHLKMNSKASDKSVRNGIRELTLETKKNPGHYPLRIPRIHRVGWHFFIVRPTT
jgi:hypothetical protein